MRLYNKECDDTLSGNALLFNLDILIFNMDYLRLSFTTHHLLSVLSLPSIYPFFISILSHIALTLLKPVSITNTIAVSI